MIFGNINNFEQERKVLAQPLIKGLEYLLSTDLAKIPAGRYAIDGTRIYAIVQEYQTSPREECIAETHRQYVDLQFMQEGVEIIGWGLTDSMQEISQDLTAEKDAVYYQAIENEHELVLTTGRYAIFFPTDIHRPGCNFERGGQVKKIVLKIAWDLF